MVTLTFKLDHWENTVLKTIFTLTILVIFSNNNLHTCTYYLSYNRVAS